MEPQRRSTKVGNSEKQHTGAFIGKGHETYLKPFEKQALDKDQQENCLRKKCRKPIRMAGNIIFLYITANTDYYKGITVMVTGDIPTAKVIIKRKTKQKKIKSYRIRRKRPAADKQNKPAPTDNNQPAAFETENGKTPVV